MIGKLTKQQIKDLMTILEDITKIKKMAAQKERNRICEELLSDETVNEVAIYYDGFPADWQALNRAKAALTAVVARIRGEG